MGPFLQGPAVEIEEARALGRHHGHLLVVQVYHLLGMFQDGRDIRGHKHLRLPDADGHPSGVAQPGGDQLVRLQAAEHGDGVSTLDAVQGLADRFLQAEALYQVVLDQVDDHLGIGLGLELVAVGPEFTA